MSIHGFIGVDAGTQGLSVTYTDEAMQVIATGEGDYDMVPRLPSRLYNAACQRARLGIVYGPLEIINQRRSV